MPGAYIVFYLDLSSFFWVIINPVKTSFMKAIRVRNALVEHKSHSMMGNITESVNEKLYRAFFLHVYIYIFFSLYIY